MWRWTRKTIFSVDAMMQHKERVTLLLLVTCKLNNDNPCNSLKNVLSRDINEMPVNQINTLLPYNWKDHNVQKIEGLKHS